MNYETSTNEARTSSQQEEVSEVTERKEDVSAILRKRMDNMLREEIERFRKGEDRMTGFPSLDENLGGLQSGLYLVGATTSLGKTTFIHQIGDQLAEQGHNILFFSLEQSASELLIKSLTRSTSLIQESLGQQQQQQITNKQIRRGESSPALLQAKCHYLDKIAPRVEVFEGNFSCTSESITEEVKQFQKKNPGISPVVIVDYLQILQSDSTGSTKDKVDSNLAELKKLSRDYSLVVIVISSVNRSSYLSPMDFESFKESGGVEYTADVVLGLQLELVGTERFQSEKNLEKKRKSLNTEKACSPRKLELVILKNRFGKIGSAQQFRYYPELELFREYPQRPATLKL